MAKSVARARERFLETGDVPAAASLHPGIVESWRRSGLSGVACHELDPPYVADLDTEGRLMHAAKPVLDRLEQTLSDTGTSVILADAQARMLDRRASEPSLRQQMDRIQAAPGFNYAEEHVGTNGIGTACETRQIAFVVGSEHFRTPLHEVACACAPVIDRLTGRLAGVVNITSWAHEASALMSALVSSAAEDIERRLLELGSKHERMLLLEFMAAQRRGGQAIVMIADGLTMATREATDLLAPSDHAIVRDKVAELFRGDTEYKASIELSRGEWATLRCRPVGANGDAMVSISLADKPRSQSRPQVRPADLKLAGTSTVLANVCADLARLRQSRRPVLVRGEPGVGKLQLARAVHFRYAPDKPFVVIEPTLDVAIQCRAAPGVRVRPRMTVVVRPHM
ncbi:sigma 54-interacting transcriptional regulator [Nonomuraea angiospora]|uniref:sigma-54-dependent Fis family transcriptional regulator n=1 Tax=Nonomuraea angiospora TaxID=46172 RepID=UPI00332F9C04